MVCMGAKKLLLMKTMEVLNGTYERNAKDRARL